MAWFWQKQNEEQKQSSVQANTEDQKRKIREQVRGVKKQSKPKTKQSATKKQVASSTAVADRTLVGPIVTEKAARLAEHGTYAFTVTPTANKIEVARAVSEVYSVHPTKVAIVNTHAKPKNFAQRKGTRSSFRKAYVTLKQGEKIELFEQ